MKKLLIVLDTFPSLSETFVYNTINNLRSEFNVQICARRKGASPHILSDFSNVIYLPGECYPLLIKLLILAIQFLICLWNHPRKTKEFLRNLFQNQNKDYKRLFLEAYRVLPLLAISKDLTYFSFGGLAVKYLEFIKFEKKAIFSLRGSDINIEPLLNNDYKKRLKDAITHASAIHCVCNDIKYKAETLAGEKLEKAHVIYTAVSPIFITKNAQQFTQSTKLKIVTIGRLDWRKGLEHGMMAIRQLVDRGLEFEWQIIGDGDYKIPLQWAIRDMELQDHVHLLGAKNQSDIHVLLKQSQIYFHPAVHEGISNAVLEAMAVGLPVVCCSVGGMVEAISSDAYGLVVPPRDWRAMTGALQMLIESHELRTRIGINGSQMVRERFSIEQQVDGFRSLFNSVMNCEQA